MECSDLDPTNFIGANPVKRASIFPMYCSTTRGLLFLPLNVGGRRDWQLNLPIATSVVSSNPIQAIQHYVVGNLLQVGDFLRVLRFPPPIKLTAMI